jgi:hypothetical protein
MLTDLYNCTAFDIIECLGDEIDLMEDPMSVKWRCWLHRQAYDKLRNDTSRTLMGLNTPEWIYEKDGVEYVRVWENERLGLHLDMRIAGIDNSLPMSLPGGLGCIREVDKPV